MKPSKLLAHILLFAVTLIYAATYSIAKFVMDPGYIGPYGFIVFRVLAALILFWAIAPFFPKERVKRKDLGLLFLCGVFGVAINQSFFFAGLHLTTPIHASLIMVLTPLIVLPVSALLVREAVTGRKIAGLVLGISGAVLLIAYGKEIAFVRKGVIGDLFIMINAISYSIYLVLVKRLSNTYHALTISRYVFLFSLILVLPIGWQEASAVDWRSFGPKIWLSFVYVLVFTTFLAYLFNALAMQTVNASVVSIYIYLQPIMATAIALILGQDTLTLTQVISAGLIFYGVYLVSFSPPKTA